MLELFKLSKYRDKQVVEQLLLYTQTIYEIRKINNQSRTHRDMLDSIRYVDFVNDHRIILKMHHTVKRNYRIFEMRERIGFAKPKRVTTVEVSL